MCDTPDASQLRILVSHARRECHASQRTIGLNQEPVSCADEPRSIWAPPGQKSLASARKKLADNWMVSISRCSASRLSRLRTAGKEYVDGRGVVRMIFVYRGVAHKTSTILIRAFHRPVAKVTTTDRSTYEAHA